MKLYYDQPARNWHESLPMGNGRLGATVYGGTKKETLALMNFSFLIFLPETQSMNRPSPTLRASVLLPKFLLWQQAISTAWKTSKNFFMPAVQRSS